MNPFMISMMIWLKPDGQKGLLEFKEKAAPLFIKYGIKIERVVAIKNKGQIVGQNLWDTPHLIQIISAPSLENFQKYLNDPEYIKLSPLRDQSAEKIIASMGPTMDTSQFNSASHSELSQRLYGVGFVKFKENGRSGLLNFNAKAIEVFKRHGMHVESMFDAKASKAATGEMLSGFAPELIVTFFLDSAESLKAYISDPEYQALAVLRDNGLMAYDFFTGFSRN